MIKNIVQRLFLSNTNLVRNLSTTSRCLKADDRRQLIASTPRKDQGTEGEKTIEIDQIIQRQ